jgi:hypothetical protein
VDGNIRNSLPRDYLRNWHQLLLSISWQEFLLTGMNARQGSGDGVGDRAGGRRDKTGPS